MKVLRSYRVLRFTLVLTAILAQCVALSSISLLVIAGILASLSWHVTEGPRGKSIPPWVSRLLVLVVLLFSVFDSIGPYELLPHVLGRFVIWLTVIKLYGKRTVENEAQLLLLSLLLLAVGALYATDILFGILLVCWTGLAAWVLLMYQLHHGIETMRAERYGAVPEDYPTPWTRPVTGLHVRKTFRRSAALFLFISFLGSAFLFVAIPRKPTIVTIEQTMARYDAQERMELKPDDEIKLSSRQVMELSIRNQEGEPVRLIRGVWLRGSVLDEYQGKGVWETGKHYKSTFETVQGEHTNLTPIENKKNLLAIDVSLLLPMTKLYSLYRPVGLETNPPTRVTMNLANATMGLALGSIPLHKYSLLVDPEDIIVSPFSPKLLYYQNEEVRSLAIKIMQQVSVNEDELAISSEARRRVARAFVMYLQSDDFEYSTNGLGSSIEQRTSSLHSEDPTAMFLLQSKRGHCEFFAAAMVAMCDTVKLPARVVTGFFTDRWVEKTKTYDVLERDAHAWVEVETQPLGWESYDPTPPSGDSRTAQETLTYAQNLRTGWEHLENIWNLYVVGYDFNLQKRLVVFADPYWRQHVRNVTSFFSNLYDRLVKWFDIGAGGRLWVDLVMGAMILSGCALLILRWRRKRTKKLLQLSTRVEESVAVGSVEFYARLQRVFAKHGLIRPLHVPVMNWVQSLKLPEDCEVIALSLSMKYYTIRYGNHEPTRNERFTLMQSVKQLDSLLRKDFK